MRYARVLACLLLMFMLAGVGSQMLRHLVAGEGFRSEGLLAFGDGSNARSVQTTTPPTTGTPPSTTTPKPKKTRKNAPSGGQAQSTGAVTRSISEAREVATTGPSHSGTLGLGYTARDGQQANHFPGRRGAVRSPGPRD